MTPSEIIAIATGITFISIILIIALFIPNPSKFQYNIFKTIIAISVAGFAVTIPGLLEIQIGTFIKAGSAMGVFVLVYFYNPASLLVKKKDKPIDIVDSSVIDNPNIYLENINQSHNNPTKKEGILINQKESDEYGNEFPALDIKLRNSSDFKKLVKTITIKVHNCIIDETPLLEFSLEIKDNNLYLFVRNYGYGSCYNFNGLLDFEILNSCVKKSYKITIKADEIDDFKEFLLIDKNDLNFSDADKKYKFPNEDSNNLEEWDQQNYIAHNGIDNIPAKFTYFDKSSNQIDENIMLDRIQRGAYDWRKIYITEKGFEYITYDGGVRYSLMFPSCSYNVLLKPDFVGKQIKLPVAHQIESDSFERIWIIIGSNISAIYNLSFSISMDNGDEIDSEIINIEIWNPKNTYNSKHGGELKEINSIQASKTDYNIKEIKKIKTRSFGY